MQGRGHWTYDCYYLKHKIQDLIDQDLWSLYVSPISRPERMQYHLHITRDNEMINIESCGQLTLSPIASDIHKTVGLPHQLNVTVRPTTCMEYIAVAQPSCVKYRISFYSQVHAKKTRIGTSFLFCWYS